MIPAGLHAFGKLPIAQDFIHYRADGDAREVAEWLEAGHGFVVSLRNGGAPASDGEGIRYRFAFEIGAGRKLALGVLLGSRDAKGRKFPFALFATVDAAPFRGHLGVLPLLLDRGWEALDRETEQLAALDGAETLAKRLDGLTLGVPAPGRESVAELERRLREARGGDVWGTMLPGADAERRLVLFEWLVRALAPATDARGATVPILLRLPLGGNAEGAAVQAGFWVELVGRILGGSRGSPSLFLEVERPGAVPRAIHLYGQRPDERSFAYLVMPAWAAEYVNDLASDLPSPGNPVLPGAVREAIRGEGSTLADMLTAPWR